MVATEFIVGAFATCNALRIAAYIPRYLKILRDEDGARAVSLGTWGLFTVRMSTTVAYALAIVDDRRMAAVFSLNAAACLAISQPDAGPSAKVNGPLARGVLEVRALEVLVRESARLATPQLRRPLELTPSDRTRGRL